MTQIRIWNPADLLTQGRTALYTKVIAGPGLYSGYTPTIVGDWAVTLSSGSLILPNGVEVSETSTITIDTLPVLSEAIDYTLVAAQSDTTLIGGAPVLYSWVTGIQPRYDDDGNVAVLYVRYPGTGVLTEAILSTPSYQKATTIGDLTNDAFTWIAAPFTTACDIVKGSNIAYSNASSALGAQYLGWSVTNSASSGSQTLQFRLPLPVNRHARQVQVYATLPNLSTLSFITGTYTSRDGDGNVLTLDPTSVSGPVTSLSAPAVEIDVSSSVAQMTSFGVTLTLAAGTTAFFWGVQIVTD
jgi:hypothetical protein